MRDDPGAANSFTTTQWSLVLAAGGTDAGDAAEALERLCRRYWYPLYAYVRRRGHAEPEAQDLTQGFFEHLLQRHAFRQLTPGKAKFRSYLLAALNHFLADEYARKMTQKRGGGHVILSLDATKAEERYQSEPRHDQTPDALFARRWAVDLLNAALLRLQRECVDGGKQAQFDHFCRHLSGDGQRGGGAVLRAESGLSDEAAKKAAQRTRNRFRAILREEIARTVTTTAEIDEELRALQQALQT